MSQDKGLILVIEDEPQMQRFLRIVLQGQGYRFIEAQTGEEGLMQAATHSPDIILLDLGLPDIDGLEVTGRLREWSDMPIIILSAREQEQDKIKALDAGADDYLTKPFGAGELLARIRVAVRHKVMQQTMQGEPVFVLDNLRVEMSQRQVFLNEQEVHLTPIEYKLLTVLIQNAGRVVTHTNLLTEVWGPSYSKETQYLRVYMTQLRHKLESDPARPRFLINEPGIGYRLRTEMKE
jgi:two-component system KDP operon response regulator KdpE